MAMSVARLVLHEIVVMSVARLVLHELVVSIRLTFHRLPTNRYLGMPTRVDQERILRAQTRRFSLAADVDLAQVAECLPHNLTGADLYALSADAVMCAIRRTITLFAPEGDEGSGGGGDSSSSSGDGVGGSGGGGDGGGGVVQVSPTGPVVVEPSDFAQAIANLKPSVSLRELERYEELHQSFQAQREG
jgi:peroxin-6